jgi:hypothetical protein
VASAGDVLDPGFGFQVGRLFRAEELVGFKIDALFARFDLDESVSDFIGMNRAHAWLWHVSGNVVLSAGLTGESSRARLYAIGGAGVYQRRTTLSEPRSGVLFICDPFLEICPPEFATVESLAGTRSTTGIGFNGGVGIAVRTGTHHSFFIETRFHHGSGQDLPDRADRSRFRFASSGDSRFIPIVLGLRF